MTFADAAGDQFLVLSAEIQYQNDLLCHHFLRVTAESAASFLFFLMMYGSGQKDPSQNMTSRLPDKILSYFIISDL